MTKSINIPCCNNHGRERWNCQNHPQCINCIKNTCSNKKVILDVCCGPKSFWFNKNHPNTVYQDIRREEKGFYPDRPNCEVQPDLIGDFRDIRLPDKWFKLVVFDPPHIIQAGEKAWLRKKYGIIGKDWKEDLTKGFNECWRVLEDYGVLIFKWNEADIKVTEILKLFHTQPLFGHPTSKHGKTKWMTFMKIPEVNNGL